MADEETGALLRDIRDGIAGLSQAIARDISALSQKVDKELASVRGDVAALGERMDRELAAICLRQDAQDRELAALRQDVTGIRADVVETKERLARMEARQQTHGKILAMHTDALERIVTTLSLIRGKAA